MSAPTSWIDGARRWSWLMTLLAVACGAPGPEQASPGAAETLESTPLGESQDLSVAMFPWIPDAAGDDFAALWAYYETEFEALHPDVDVSVGTATGSYYDPVVVAGWLESGAYDVVELDMVMLGDVIATGAIQPFWDASIADRFFPASVQAVQLETDYWAVPHLMCTYFLLSRDATVAAATNYAELAAALAALPAGQRFAGNLTAGWDTTALYVESFYQQEIGSPAAAVANPVMDQVLGNLHELSLLCVNSSGANWCLDGYYDTNYNQAAIDFALGTSATSFGYSERLWVVLTQPGVIDPAGILPSALQMGTADNQLVFTDAFVISKDCTGDCLDAALDWVAYATSDAALGYMLASEDAGAGSVPRYLLPANLGALTYGPLVGDPYYPQFVAALVATSPLPSQDVPEYKDVHGAEIAEVIADGP